MRYTADVPPPLGSLSPVESDHSSCAEFVPISIFIAVFTVITVAEHYFMLTTKVLVNEGKGQKEKPPEDNEE